MRLLCKEAPPLLHPAKRPARQAHCAAGAAWSHPRRELSAGSWGLWEGEQDPAPAPGNGNVASGGPAGSDYAGLSHHLPTATLWPQRHICFEVSLLAKHMRFRWRGWGSILRTWLEGDPQTRSMLNISRTTPVPYFGPLGMNRKLRSALLNPRSREV